ncbi:MAG: hypothetical protein ACOCXJ_01065 [Planctomycetota bacterium]
MRHLVLVLLCATMLRAASPTVQITAPVDGAASGSTVTIASTVTGWEMSPGGRHARWFVDGVDQGPRYDSAPFTVDGLDAGEHILRIDLREVDHSPIGVADSVSFQVGASTAWTGRLVTSDLDQPVWATHAPGEPDRLYVCEQHTGGRSAKASRPVPRRRWSDTVPVGSPIRCGTTGATMVRR